ncbi:MAG TPA: hypothetical protein VHW74_16960 [Mycobacteriales bacterium]|jgi:hypothetical protein|nr:hypothetical protein [Mycobacteriales bacterium]
MLYALRQPGILLGLALGFAVSMLALSAATRLLNRKTRYPRPFWDPQSWLDPYGVVAALLGGTGWAPKPEARRGFGRTQHRQLWLITLVSVLVPGIVGAVAIAGYAALIGHGALAIMQSYSVLHGDDFAKFIAPTIGEKILLGIGIESLTIAVLALFPIPPLPMGVAAWTVFPRTPGARQLAYRLLEEYWGIVVLLVLFVIPFSNQGPLLLFADTSIVDSILHAI